jgi:hypothetical protein
MAKCVEELEQDMELLGVTGVEGRYLGFFLRASR